MNSCKFYIVSFDFYRNLKYTYYETQELLDTAKSEFGNSFISSGITEYIGSPGFRRPKIENFKFEKLSDDEIKTIKEISERMYLIILEEEMHNDDEFWKQHLSYKKNHGYTAGFTKEMLYLDYKKEISKNNTFRCGCDLTEVNEPTKATRKSTRISNLQKFEDFVCQENVNSEFAKILKENKVWKATVEVKNKIIKLYGVLSESEFKSKKLVPDKFIKYKQSDFYKRTSRDD